jgi:DNA transformation protein
MCELSKHEKIGKVISSQLNEIGIKTLSDLKKIGSKKAWLKIKEKNKTACFNKLCSLEGAIQGVKWHTLTIKERTDLKNFYNLHSVSK